MPRKQTLILKVVRIFLLGVLSNPAAIRQHTPTAPPATLDGTPPPPPAAAAAEAAAEAEAAAAGEGAPSGDGVDGTAAAAAAPEGSTGGAAAGLEVSCGSSSSSSSTETADTRVSPEESVLESGALSPLESGDRGVGGASAIASGPGLGERGGRLWACLPVDVTAAVLGAVELPDLQVGKVEAKVLVVVVVVVTAGSLLILGVHVSYGLWLVRSWFSNSSPLVQ